jgi:hypothetical protein
MRLSAAIAPTPHGPRAEANEEPHSADRHRPKPEFGDLVLAPRKERQAGRSQEDDHEESKHALLRHLRLS